MSEYYAVTRSTDHLMHYGVKGMKWGVRKAIRSGNSRRISRQFRKAARKLEKLNAKADIANQRVAATKHNKRALRALGVGVTGAGIVGGNHALATYLAGKSIAGKKGNTQGVTGNSYTPVQTARKKRIVGEGKGIRKGESIGSNPVGQDTDALSNAINGKVKKNSGPNGFKTIRDVGALMTLGGLGTAVYQKGKAVAAKRRTTAKGHAKAVAKRDAWKREMDAAFRGTGYRSYDAKNYRRKKSK